MMASVGPATKVDEPASGKSNSHHVSRRDLITKFLWGNGMLLLVLFALIVGFSIYAPGFFTVDNFRNIGVNSSALLILSTATLYVLISGSLDLSIGSILVFSGVVSAKVMERVGGGSLGAILVGLVAALATGAACGAINGLLVTRARVASLIVTLGSLGALLGAAELLANGTDLTNIPVGLVTHVGFDSILGIPTLIWIAVGVAVVAGIFLAHTRFGRYSYAIGSNVEGAVRAGVPVKRHLLKVFILSGFLAGLAGYLDLAQYSSTTISGHTNDVLYALTAVVLGGTSIMGGSGTMTGTVIGVAIPAVLLNGLVVANLQPFWQQIAVGIVLVLAVYIDGVRRRRHANAISQ